jgi:hypothetical protein
MQFIRTRDAFEHDHAMDEDRRHGYQPPIGEAKFQVPPCIFSSLGFHDPNFDAALVIFGYIFHSRDSVLARYTVGSFGHDFDKEPTALPNRRQWRDRSCRGRISGFVPAHVLL